MGGDRRGQDRRLKGKGGEERRGGGGERKTVRDLSLSFTNENEKKVQTFLHHP